MQHDELEALMEEPPGGHNHGRVATADGLEPLDNAQAQEFMREGGWSIVDTSRGSGGIDVLGAADAGMTSHRGVLQGDEYIDVGRLKKLAEQALGFTYEEISSVYRQGPLSARQRELRDKIDSRLLALSRSGGNVAALGRVLGWSDPKTMERAVARAREAE